MSTLSREETELAALKERFKELDKQRDELQGRANLFLIGGLALVAKAWSDRRKLQEIEELRLQIAERGKKLKEQLASSEGSTAPSTTSSVQHDVAAEGGHVAKLMAQVRELTRLFALHVALHVRTIAGPDPALEGAEALKKELDA